MVMTDVGAKIVDVIIPNFNRTHVVKNAIDSVNRNSNINKIWLIDDGSDFEICSFYDTLKIDNLEIIRHARVCDPGFLRRLAILQSNADWIAFLDSDDLWLNDKISVQLNFASKNRIDFVCSPAVDELTFPTSSWKKSIVKINPISLMANNFVVMSSVLVKRELLTKVDTFCFGSSYIKIEDLGTWMRLSHFTNFGVTRERLVRFNISEDSFGKGLHKRYRTRLLLAHLKWIFSSENINFLSKIQNFIFIFCAEITRRLIFAFRRLKVRSKIRQLRARVWSNQETE